MEQLHLSSVPLGEACIQVSPDWDYLPAMMIETKIFVAQLRRQWPNAHFKIVKCPHDFGTYTDVVVLYGTDDEEEQALDIECSLPENWDSTSRGEVKRLYQSLPKERRP